MKKLVLIALLWLCFAVPALAEYPAFDLENGIVTLNNGVEMPILGIGTFAMSSEQAENSVYWALRDGYHLIDTARIYGNEDGVLEVVKVYRNSPAKEAGMQPGDIIVKVDGKEYSGDESSEAAANIRGKEGTSVELTYRRSGTEHTVTMVRASIQVETIEYEMLEDNLGYILIDGFESATARDFKEALDDLTAKGAKGLIIDLRDNGGGLVDQSIKIADMLMEQGTVVYTEDHNKKKDYYTTSAGRTGLPYVVLVNEYTASASEILSAGIQDNNEGIIIGTKTYGKGIIQSLYPSSMVQDRGNWDDGSAVKITIMQYFSPSGKTIHKVGITPDYIVELVEGDETDYQLQKAIEVLKTEVK